MNKNKKVYVVRKYNRGNEPNSYICFNDIFYAERQLRSNYKLYLSLLPYDNPMTFEKWKEYDHFNRIFGPY